MALPPDAADIIARLELKPHPEGGHYRETFRDTRTDADGRSRSTAIYFLLARGERSHWHRIDAVEVWHYYAGAPLTLQIADDGGQRSVRLGPDLAAGEAPQAIVPPHAWQAAESTGDWTLVGCTVAPGFEFAKFELAPRIRALPRLNNCDRESGGFARCPSHSFRPDRQQDMRGTFSNPYQIEPAILYLEPGGADRLAQRGWILQPRADVVGMVGRMALHARARAQFQDTENMIRTGECVLNLPSADLVAAVDRLARTTGSDPVPAGKTCAATGTRRTSSARAA